MCMKSNRILVSRISRPLIAAVLGVVAGVPLIVCGADEAAAFKPAVTHPAPAVASSSPSGLPVVARPPAMQPPVGLPTDTHLDKTPPRKTRSLDLVRNGWTYNCMECHKLLPARWQYDRPLNEHQDIKLDHGNNRFCLNCHHATNRNAFVDYDASEIAQADVVLLCAKCHGPTYRDWKAGVHGRANGFWNAGLGEKTKLRCIQCHDPHHPKFPAMKPLPPLRYPARAAAGGSDASSRQGERDAHVANPQARQTKDPTIGNGGIATTPERRGVASKPK